MEIYIRGMEWLSDGWITAGLCPNHPWVLLLLGWKSLFYVCVNCCCMRRHGKAYEYNNDGRYVWNEQQQQRQYNIVSFVLSKSSIDYYLLTTTTAVSWVQRVSLPIAGDQGLIPRDGAIDRRYFYEPLMVITCFRVRCCYCCWCKMVVAYCRAPTYRAYWLRYVIDESMVWVGFLLWIL